MKIVESRPVSVAEAKKLLEQRSKDAELEYEQAQAADHSDKFSTRTPEAVQKLAKEIMEKSGKLDLEISLKLADICPKQPETLKSILLRKKVDLSDEEAEELLKILQK